MARAQSERFEVDPATHLGHRPALDGLRALAVLPVMLGHAVSSTAPGGFSGVRLFFVLSGFLITTLLVEEWASRGLIRLGAFYTRRALRLLPALFFVLAVDLVVVAAFDGASGVSSRMATVGSVVAYVANWKFIAAPLGPNAGRELGHLWSLSVEEQFYFLWPLGLVLLLRFAKARTMLVITALLAAVSWGVSEVLALSAKTTRNAIELGATVKTAGVRHEFYGTDAVAYAILVGCLVALLRSSGRIGSDARTQRFLQRAAVAGVLFYGIVVVFYPASGTREVLLGVLTIGFAFMILGAVDAPRSVFAQLLSIPVLQAIGRVSYGLYLWHFVVLSQLRRHYALQTPQLVILAAILTTAATLVSYRFVEQPFLRLKRRFSSERALGAAEAVPSAAR
ncbi:MAG TPA: acyltransferase [Acidimicrobiia bacterium]|nr:acyltransferase [Acidimicrobiia bacterium]